MVICKDKWKEEEMIPIIINRKTKYINSERTLRTMKKMRIFFERSCS